MAVYSSQDLFQTNVVFKLVLNVLSFAMTTRGDENASGNIDRWVNPCAGSMVSNVPLIFNVTVPSGNYTLTTKDIVLDFRNTRETARNLKESYRDTRINNDLEKSYNMEHLQGFPTVERPITSTELSIGRRFLRDFQSFSRVAVFLNQTLQDEDEPRFRRKLQLLENQIYGVLCKLDSGIHNLNLKIEMHVSGDIMSSGDRFLFSRKDRDRRDYILIKDTIDLLDSLIMEYKTALNSHDP